VATIGDEASRFSGPLASECGRRGPPVVNCLMIRRARGVGFGS
jgi:hypothetical protein